MSNIHSELVDAQIHKPKGFDAAGNDTYLTKNNSGNLDWSGIGTGHNCGIYKDYDYARWSTGGNTFANVSILTDTITLTNCSGIVGTRLELEIFIVTEELGGSNDPSVWACATGSNSQEIIDNQLVNGTGRLPACNPAYVLHCGPGVNGVGYHWKAVFDVTTTDMTSIIMKFGSCDVKTIEENQSWIMVKEFCVNRTVQDLG
tara:strand:+ start:1025 stop:1630 length:606 start_codon:yes stop_codon:yes gene_type:complete